MPLIDTLFVFGVVAAFTIFAAVLFWGWWQTRDTFKPFN
jgi:hypothetical protein